MLMQFMRAVDLFQVKPPVPVYMSFMMYNVDNPEEIVNGSKPKLTEVGPFVYRETREKQNLHYSADDCSIKFGQYKRYDFDEERTNQICPTCGRADKRVVTMINAPYVGVMQLLQTAYGMQLLKKTFNIPQTQTVLFY